MVPYERAEEVARDLIRASAQTDPPVDLNRILGLLPGVSVTFEQLDNDGYLVQVPGGAEILISANTRRERQRFTLAHELGHHALAIGLAGEGGSLTHAQRERWCDRFAVELLMPHDWMERSLDTRIPRRRAAFVTHGHRAFMVSKSAFRLRLEELANVWILEIARSNSGAAEVDRTLTHVPAHAVALAAKCASMLARTDVKVLRAADLEVTCLNVGKGSDEEAYVVAIIDRVS